MSVTIKVKPKQLEVVTKTLSAREASEILDGLGALLVGQFQASWRQQKSPGGKPWPARMVPNVAGVVADLNKNGNPKSRRFDARPAVVDTGKLRNSLSWSTEGGVLRVGTNVSYASTHNEGGSTTHTLTPVGRRKLAMWLRRDRRRRVHGLGWLFGKPSFTVKARKRPFVEIGPAQRRTIREHVEQEIARRVNG